jgi:DNA helicase II / ATP-dependent DNA helicase PcrA
MLYFSQKYENTKFIVLTENYRSTQNILDVATESINFNKSRITNYIPGLQKILNSNRKDNDGVEFYNLPSEIEEKALVMQKIKSNLKQ